MSLRKRAILLAYTNPSLRSALLPLLKTGGASSTVVELTTPKQRLQSRALEGKVFGGKFPDFPHRRFGIYEGNQLVATVRANQNPLRSWKTDEAYPLLAALKPEVWISATAVDPAHRGKGYATALRTRLQKEYSSILTSTGKSSDPAIKLLNERQGFKPVLTRPSVVVYHWSRH